jgi:hypothetical protein
MEIDTPGAFAGNANSNNKLETRYGRQMQDALRTYSKVAALVDREVIVTET